MEPLSIAASIIAVVQISAQVVAVCARYIDGLLDCPQELRHVLVEIATLKGLFESLKILVGCDPDTAVLDEQLQGPVDGCRKAIIELSALLGDAADEVDNGDHEDDGGRRTKDSDEEDERVAGGSRRVKKRRRVGLSMSVRLAWPLKQKRVMRLLDLIGVYKSSIALILSGQGLYVIDSDVIGKAHLLTGNRRDTRVIREQMVVVASKIDGGYASSSVCLLADSDMQMLYEQSYLIGLSLSIHPFNTTKPSIFMKRVPWAGSKRIPDTASGSPVGELVDSGLMEFRVQGRRFYRHGSPQTWQRNAPRRQSRSITSVTMAEITTRRHISSAGH